MHQFTYNLTAPIGFSYVLTRVAQSSHNAFYRIKEGRLGRALLLGAQPAFVEIEPDESGLSWQVTLHGANSEQEGEAKRVITHLFGLETDLRAFYAHCSHDPVMDSICQRLSGAPMLLDPDVFTSVISSVISQQLNLKFAAELKRRLWELAGIPVEVDGETYYSDPTPEAIAALDYQTLRNKQYSQRKAEYVIDFARAVVDGTFDLARLQSLDDETAIAYLVQVRGLGRWTAECVLLFGLGRPDLLPALDVGLQKSVTRFWRLPERISEAALREMAETWKPWRSWYTYYLWLALTLTE